MISIKQKGNFSKTEKFLKKSFGKNYLNVLNFNILNLKL